MNAKNLVAISAAILFIMAGSLFAQAQPPMAVPDQPPEIESQIPGEIQVARWDMLLNQAGADTIKKTAQPAASKSKIYQAFTCNGFELRQAMADAIANNGVEQTSQMMAFAQMFNGQTLMIPQQLNFNYYGGNQKAVKMNGFVQQSLESLSRQPADHLKIVINDALSNLSIVENNRQTQIKSKPVIDYDGDLAPGDAIAFMAPFTAPSKTVYYQLTVWETFKAPSPLVEYMSTERSAAWWCQNGPGKLRKWATVASIWESQNSHRADDVAPAFVKKLGDGKELKLIGLTRPDVAPWCWWDAQGKPVTGIPGYGVSFDGDPPAGLWAAVELTGTGAEVKLRTPATQPVEDVNRGMPQSPVYIQYGFVKVDDGTTDITAGALVGPWQEIAHMNVGETKQIDGATFKIDSQQKYGPNNFAARFSFPDDPNSVFAISAVGPDGKESASFGGYYQDINFPNKSKQNHGPTTIFSQFQGIEMADIQYFRLCQRKRENQTFTSFASQPLAPVKTDFTPDEVAAALKAKQAQDEQTQIQVAKEMQAQSQAARKDWDAIKPDITQPMGMLKILATAAANGDEKTVRSLMQSPNAADLPLIDAAAHFLTLAESNWKKAIDKFGEEKVAQLAHRNPQFQGFGLQFSQIPWTKSDDGTWKEGDQMALRKDAEGHYYMDLTGMATQPGATKGMKEMETAEDKVAAALNQPNVTLEQLLEATAALNIQQ